MKFAIRLPMTITFILLAVHIPKRALWRIAGAADEKVEVRRLVVETIRAVSAVEGVAGVRLMGYRVDDILGEAVVELDVRRGVRIEAA